MASQHNYHLSILFFLLFSFPVFSQTASTEKTITGIITVDGVPLENVNIIVKDSKKGTKTDRKGYYEVKAEIGKTLKYSYVGLNPLEIIVEDVTSKLNIAMKSAKNELETTLIKAKEKKDLISEMITRKDVSLLTPIGYVNPKTSALPITHILGENMRSGVSSIIREIANKAALMVQGIPPNERIIIRGRPGVFVLDGLVYENNPPIFDASQISDLFIFRSKGFIVMVPKSASHIRKLDIEKIAEQYRNQNYYANDAIAFEINETFQEPLKTQSIDEVYNFFKQYKDSYDYNDQMAFANYLYQTYQNVAVPSEILNDLVKKHYDDPEILKAIAYHFQKFGNYLDAINVYKSLLNIRPNYAQSYKDLANVYKENNAFQKSWKTYLTLIDNFYHETNQEFIDLVFNEMEYLYYNRKNQTQIKEHFSPKYDNRTAFEKDVRMVFEWNTSEAEFELEFVGPEQRSFAFKHDLYENQDLINKEKTYGYTSKEFFIEDLGYNEWFVNLTYHGNKKDTPTYLKMTTYTDWGRSQQKEEIKIFRLVNTDTKYKIKTFTKNSLISFNLDKRIKK